MRIAVVLALVTCACVAEDESTVELGVIDFYGAPPRIEAPLFTTPGAWENVIVSTYGGGCITYDHTDVFLTPDGADIYPYDHHARGHGLCSQELRYLPHVVYVTWETPGAKMIRVHGRLLAPDYEHYHGLRDEEIEAPVTLDVQ